MAREADWTLLLAREEEIQRVIQILSRRTKNNPCLIGEPGVGKTAIAGTCSQNSWKEMCLRQLRTSVF